MNTLRFYSLEALVVCLFMRWNPFASSVSYSEQLSNNKTEASFHIKLKKKKTKIIGVKPT